MKRYSYSTNLEYNLANRCKIYRKACNNSVPAPAFAPLDSSEGDFAKPAQFSPQPLDGSIIISPYPPIAEEHEKIINYYPDN